MKLVDLDPSFVGAGGAGISDKDGNPVPERTGIGVSFDCPCGKCGVRCYVGFKTPLDGGPPRGSEGEPMWDRTGDTFETLTLSPSVYRPKEKGGCGWHGWVKSGEVTSC
jgi:hypothetical protein